MTRVLGVDVPTSVIRIKGRDLRYMEQPAMSDSYGVTSAPDWPTPISLEFGIKLVHAEKLGAVAEVGECPMPPEELLGRMEMAVTSSVRRIARMLKDKGQVVQAEGMSTDLTMGPFGGVGLRTLAIAWPAVPGVTTRYEDTTR